jgi:hypothetical protein
VLTVTELPVAAVPAGAMVAPPLRTEYSLRPLSTPSMKSASDGPNVCFKLIRLPDMLLTLNVPWNCRVPLQ